MSWPTPGRTDIRIEAALAKLYASEMAWLVADELVQIRGGRGFETAESLAARGERGVPAEQVLRDLRINRIFEGSTEIMHLMIAREAVDAHLAVAGDIIDPEADPRRKVAAAAKAGKFYARWLPTLVAGKGQLPTSFTEFGPLAGHLRYVERASRRLARSTFYGMSRWQGRLEHKQRFLGRIVDIGAELFAMTAACVRAQRDRADGTAIELADAFCRQARVRADQLFDQLWHNSDDVRRDAGSWRARRSLHCRWRKGFSTRRSRGRGSLRMVARRNPTCTASFGETGAGRPDRSGGRRQRRHRAGDGSAGPGGGCRGGPHRPRSRPARARGAGCRRTPQRGLRRQRRGCAGEFLPGSAGTDRPCDGHRRRPTYGPLLEMDPAQVRDAISDHVVTALMVARNAAPKMRPGGTLLLMGGTGGRRVGHGLGIVSAATAALPPFTAALALEIAPVRVNLIAAGFVDTPLSAALLGDRLEERRNELRATLPIGRVVEPADVAALAVHIMSNTALTGATYDIDGGQQFVW